MRRAPRAAAVLALAALPLLFASCSRSFSNGNEFRNASSFAALKADGSVVAWGSSSRGGDPTCVNNPIACGAAPAGSLASGVVDIFSSYGAYAALKTDGSLAVWGGPAFGGEISCAIGGATCHPVAQADIASGVRTVSSTYSAFAALKADGSVLTWGSTDYGGDATCTPSGTCSPAPAGSLASGVSQVFGAYDSFAALKSDGSVVAWGDPTAGGDASAPVGGALAGVAGIVPNGYGFAAITAGGAVVTWGEPLRGGDPACGGGGCAAVPVGSLASGVAAVTSTNDAFAARKSDGSVVTWGWGVDGGDSSAPVGGALASVTSVAATDRAFAALKSDGSVVTWGDPTAGGDAACTPGVGCSPVPAGSLASGVVAVISGRWAFAALKSDGSVVAWGQPDVGGDPSCAPGVCTPAPAGALSAGVTQVMWTNDAFVARKRDGSVVTWGNTAAGGDSSAPVGGALAAVSQMFSSNRAGAAIKSDGSVVTWGDPGSGGDPTCVADATCTPAPAGSLSSGVVYIASPFVPLPAAPVTPTAPTTPAASGNTGTAAGPTSIALLPGHTTCTRMRCTTRGRLPSGATRVVQVATAVRSATARAASMSARRVRGQCTITGATYACTVRLSPGRWALSTTALAGTNAVARSVRTVRIARTRVRPAITG